MQIAKIASGVFKNQSMSSEQSMHYWTEYLICHKGVPHLTPHSVKLTWYQ